MRKHRNCLRLVDEALLSLFVAVKFLVEYLYCNDTVHHHILRLQDESHSPNTDKLKYFISAVKHLADEYFISRIIHYFFLSQKADLL